MSLGGGRFTNQELCDAAITNAARKAAIDNLRSLEIATVTASGNDGFIDSMDAPACISTAVSVGSTTKSDSISFFSNSATFLSLLAPGSSIFSSLPNAEFGLLSGTSMATPHVAGAWAILKQSSPAATVSEVLDALQGTGLPITDPRNGVTVSRIQILQALNSLVGPPNLVVSPTVIQAGGTLTATWSGIATPTATDWIGLFAPNNADTEFIEWIYVSCSLAPNSAQADGSCPFVLPANLAPGSYELRLLANDGFTRLATSNAFTVTADGVSLTASPTTIPAGGAVIATWSGIALPTTTDWLGLYEPGTEDTAFLAWRYTDGQASGTLPFELPGALTPGTYELRLLANDGFLRLATSNPFTATAPDFAASARK
jgi:hypothetical protein